MKPIFIAEVKTQSPFGFKSSHSFIKLMDTAIEHGDWVSVHDNALWGGDFETISFVRKNTRKPILAKGLHYTEDDINQALDHGADYVLVVDRLPMTSKTFDKCIIEHRDFEIVTREAKVFPEAKFMCNSRDLRTGRSKEKDELPDYLKLGVWVCQASGVVFPRHVREGVSAFIVGEHLMTFCEHLL